MTPHPYTHALDEVRDDSLVFPTEFGPHVALPIAGLLARGAAFAIDVAVMVSAALLLHFLLLPLDLGTRWHTNLLAGFSLCIGLFYFIVLEVKSAGQSIGKRVVGLRVIRVDGRPLDVRSIVIRNLTRIQESGISIAAFAAIIMLHPSWSFYAGAAAITGFIFTSLFPLFSIRNQRLGDFLAGTAVIEEPSPIAFSFVPVDAPPLPVSPMMALLGSYELGVLETLLDEVRAGDDELSILLTQVLPGVPALPTPSARLQWLESFVTALRQDIAREQARAHR